MIILLRPQSAMAAKKLQYEHSFFSAEIHARDPASTPLPSAETTTFAGGPIRQAGQGSQPLTRQHLQNAPQCRERITSGTCGSAADTVAAIPSATSAHSS
jgi:hypothetical protein